MGFFSKLHRSKSGLNSLPRFSRSRLTPAGPSSLRQGSSFFTRCSRPTFLGTSPHSSPSSSSLQLRSFFGLSFVSRMLPSSLSEPFEVGSTQSIAKRVVDAIKHEQVRLAKFGSGSPSWTLHLEGPGWRASVLDCPDLSAGCLPGEKISVSPESLNFCKKDAETATVAAREVEHTLASHEAEMLVQDLCLVIDRIQMVEQRCGTGFFSSITHPEMKMIMQDHCPVTRPSILPLYLVIALFGSMLAILFACLYQIAGKRSKQITSEYNYVPSLDCRQGLSFSQPTLLGACPRASPSSSVQLSSIYGFQVKIPGPQPFQAGRTRSIAEHVVEAIKHDQVRDMEKTKHEQVRDKEKTKHDQCSLWSFEISDVISRPCEIQVWRNLDHGSPSWTVHLGGPGWQASVLDCPDLSAGSLPTGKISVSQESLHFCKMDAETATVTAHEVGHTRASHGAEMLVQYLCLVIQYILVVEQPYWIGYF